ncbi:Drug/Metabolite transporter (DMT) Superfamily [Phytophthora cinnamomi]|uniref:Drug/Metabolite transporter (DMT) Superfamily n=1 Tax=Phytophthora cinnamomi TaxID=4785 RepID=UPI00355AA224|nr:Drug/Metabolite transporter (DMT) Superfamily [Phytophthora cinnamomi]
MVAIVVLVCVCVTQAEAAQALQAVSHFSKPFFITCLDHSITILLLPALYIFHRVREYNDGVRTNKWGIADVLQRHSVHPLRKLLKIAVMLNSVYLIADYIWFTALGMISVAAGTSIGNTAPFFVYLFSMCFLHERASWKKLCGVLVSFVGVALVALYQDGAEESAKNTSVLACILVLIQTMIVAGYGVAYCVLVGEDTVDASTLLTLTVQALVEPLGLPDTEWGLFLLVVSGTLAGVFTLMQSLALCWTTPLITSVGTMMTIPLSLIWDVTINHRVFSWECLFGAMLVMTGFCILECSSPKPQVEVKTEATIT